MNREEFLSVTRLGTLITHRSSGTPIGVPVWFDWNGEVVRCFAERKSRKITRLSRDPRASLLVSNAVGESEMWVAFDGAVQISDTGGIELAELLTPRYWDLSQPDRQAVFDEWRTAPEAFVLLTMKPDQIREGR